MNPIKKHIFRTFQSLLKNEKLEKLLKFPNIKEVIAEVVGSRQKCSETDDV